MHEIKDQQSRYLIAMVVMPILAAIVFGAAVWGLSRTEQVYRAEQRV